MGFRPCWCPSSPRLGGFSFTLHLPFYFIRFLLYDRRICTHSIDPSLADCELPSLGLALVPDDVMPEAEHGVRMKQTSRFKFLPWLGIEPRTSQSNGCEHYH